MPIEQTFVALEKQLLSLGNAMVELNTTIEDRPRQGDPFVVDRLADAIQAACGSISESRAAASEASKAAKLAFDVTRIGRPLSASQQLFHGFMTQFEAEILGYGNIEDHLMEIGRERGRQWALWVDVVRKELLQCRVIITEIRECFLRCWQELVEVLHVLVEYRRGA